MEIKVLGTGCAGCRTLYETVTQAIAELVVDGRLVSAGRKLSLAEVKELLNR